MVSSLVGLSYANAGGEVLVFWRLAKLRLIGRYKWFATWMAFSGIRDFSILLAMDSHFPGKTFWTLWKFTEPIALGLVVLVSFEVFDLLTSTYKTLGSVGVTVLKVAIMLGIAVSFVLILVDWHDVTPWIFPVKRIMTVTLAIGLMCVSWAFLWVRVPIPPNVVRHCRILTVYLSSVGGGYFLLNLVSAKVLSALLMSLCLGCLVAWVLLIRRDGERVAVNRTSAE
jgi:hypothetical protein